MSSNHHQEYSPSTGEPPTPPLRDDRLTMTASVQAQNDSKDVSRQQENSSIFFGSTPPSPTEQQTGRGRSSTGQSDSGYEMSPNLPGGQQSKFFLESNVFDEDVNCSEALPDDDLSSEYANSPSLPEGQFLFEDQQFFLDDEFDQHDNCQTQPEDDKDSETLPVNSLAESLSVNDTDEFLCSECVNLDDCCCNSWPMSRPSSTTVRSHETPLNCDTHRPSELSSCSRPPSTLPIEIPLARGPSSNAPSFSRFRPRRSPPHSLPICPSCDFPGVSFLSRSHPRTLPRIFVAWNQLNPEDFFSNRRRLSSSSVPRNRPLSTNSSLFFTSLESWDDGEDNVFEEGDDNVFDETEEYDMTEEDARNNPEENRPRLNSVANPVLLRRPLPDLVPRDSIHRRNRSASINLPCDHNNEEVLRNIGRSLRRISDDFEKTRRRLNGVDSL